MAMRDVMHFAQVHCIVGTNNAIQRPNKDIRIVTLSFPDLQGSAADSARQLKVLQQAVHIKELLHVLPWNCEPLLDTFEPQSNLHFTLLVTSFISCKQRNLQDLRRKACTGTLGGLLNASFMQLT